MSSRSLAVLRLIFVKMNWNKLSSYFAFFFFPIIDVKNPHRWTETEDGYMNYETILDILCFQYSYKEKLLMSAVLIECLSNSSHMAQARKEKWVHILLKMTIFKKMGITVTLYCFLTGSTGFCFRKWQANYLLFWLLCSREGNLSTECEVTCTVLLLQLE